MKSFDLSSSSEMQGLSELLRPFSRIAGQRKIPWMLVGAAAREVLEVAFELVRGRATLDVDISVRVAIWSDYHGLLEALVEGGGARRDESIQHRIHQGAVVIDLVPFGGLEVDGGIEWPQSEGTRLNVRGFAESHEESIAVHLPGAIGIRVPSPASFICLKLMAWRDRHLDGSKDADDLRLLLNQTSKFVADDESKKTQGDLLAVNDYDSEDASAQWLGMELRTTLRPATREALQAILHEEVREDGRLELIRDMGRPNDRWFRRLSALARGLDGGAHLPG